MSEKTPNGSFNAMQQNAALEIQVADARARLNQQRADVAQLAMGEQWAKEIDIENRINSGDVQSLNDRAELEIYGSRGGTYTDPESGEVIADKDHPTKGILEEMREEPLKMNGRPQAERDAAALQRNAAADKYEKDLLKLVEKDGLELSQAKIVMDLRAKDATAKPAFIASTKEDGGTLHTTKSNKSTQPGDEITPTKKGNEVYKRLDARRIAKLKEEGAFTAEEYSRASKGLAPTPDDDNPTTEMDAMQESPGEIARRVLSSPYGMEVLQDFGNALNRYTELQSRFEGQVTGRGHEQVERARRVYEELRRRVNDVITVGMTDSGYTGNGVEVANELLRQDLGEIDLVTDLTRNELERIARENRFTRWWMRQQGTRGRLAKAGVVAVPGAVAGLALAPLVGVGVGAVAAGLIARRVATGAARARITSRIDTATHAHQRTQSRRTSQRERRMNNQDSGVTEDHWEGAQGVRRDNRNRALRAAAVGAVAGGAAGAVADLLFEGGTPQRPNNDVTPPEPEADNAEKNGSGNDNTPELNPESDIFVEAGNGITNEMAEVYPGYSGEAYYNAYQAAMEEFNGNLFNGIDTYQMANGDMGLATPGDTGAWAPGVLEFLQQQLEEESE